MNKRLGTIYFIAVLLALLLSVVLFGPAVYFQVMPAKLMDVLILDKTVPVKDYREHRGLMWVLNHRKILNEKTGAHFIYDTDYTGFFPIDEQNYEITDIPEIKQDYSLIYLADTYGVYEDDYLKENALGLRSDKIYGGLTNVELDNIIYNLDSNTIIGEFNIAEPPTNTDVKERLERLFGVKFLGWKGRYFNDLTKGVEVPVWVVQFYEEQYDKKWNYSGGGFIYVSSYDEIIVLESKKHVNKKGALISFNTDEYNVKGVIPYLYWFEVIEASRGREVVARYDLDLTLEGEKLLEAHNLPISFPAIVKDKNMQYTSWYFAGDYADYKEAGSLWQYYGYAGIKRLISSFSKYSEDYFYWGMYVPMMSKILSTISAENEKIARSTEVNSRVEGKMFQIRNENGDWEDIFIKGVNIGPAIPGRWFTQFPEDEDIYYDWFEEIGKMGANTIRIYTLLPPAFYNAFYEYNSKNKDNVLYLFQELWPEENPEGHNYLDEKYIEEYFTEIRYGIDAIYGNANIPARKGRAFGIYTRDVSEYVIGYLVGRELEPQEVMTTDELNEGYLYEGQFIYSDKDASPSEGWLALNCDYTTAYELENYGKQHPVGIVSWPTLDILSHDSESDEFGLKTNEFNDMTSIDINNINTAVDFEAGFFGAYHIYPNYPDFMNNEKEYDEYIDEYGRFRYGGYLKEFMEVHDKYPALVAEFGISTGMGNAHTSPDGYNHGGLSETEQGTGIIRMMEAMEREDYAGGLIFEWIDEWAKKTWTTEPRMVPYERQVFWHNAMCPEQNYGIVSMEPVKPEGPALEFEGEGNILSIGISHDASFLYIDLKMSDDGSNILLGIDTVDRSAGEFFAGKDENLASPFGLEFLVSLESEKDGRIYVLPGYNNAVGKYMPIRSFEGEFEEINRLINKKRLTLDGRFIEEIFHNESILKYGSIIDNTYFHWFVENNVVKLRLPWSLINFSDPSEMRVLYDDRIITAPNRDEINTIVTEGIMISAFATDEDKNVVGKVLSEQPYEWENWELIDFSSRFKDSYYIIRDYFIQK